MAISGAGLPSPSPQPLSEGQLCRIHCEQSPPRQPFSGRPLLQGQGPIWPPQAAATKDLLRIQSCAATKAAVTLPGSGRGSGKVILLLSQSPFRHSLSSRAKIEEHCDIIRRFSKQTLLHPACFYSLPLKGWGQGPSERGQCCSTWGSVQLSGPSPGICLAAEIPLFSPGSHWVKRGAIRGCWG